MALKFKPLSGGSQVVTAVLKFGKDGEVAMCGRDGYFALLVGKDLRVIETDTTEDLWAMCAIGDCIYIAGTGTTYAYTENIGFSRWMDAPDMKEMVAYGSKLYGAGYDEKSGGLWVNRGEAWEKIAPWENILAARSMVKAEGSLWIGAKSGKVSVYNFSSGLMPAYNGGVPGNSVILTEGSDILCAHQIVKYNGNVIENLKSPTVTKTGNDGKPYTAQAAYAAGVQNGVYSFLGGSDGLLAYYNSNTLKAKIVNQFTKGTILAMEIIHVDNEACLLLAGAGIMADRKDKALYNAVYIPIREVLGAQGEKPGEPPGEPPVEPPVGSIEAQKKRVADIRTLFDTELDRLLAMVN